MNSPSRPWLMTSAGGRSFSAASSTRITSSRCGPSGSACRQTLPMVVLSPRRRILTLPVSPPQAATGTVRTATRHQDRKEFMWRIRRLSACGDLGPHRARRPRGREPMAAAYPKVCPLGTLMATRRSQESGPHRRGLVRYASLELGPTWVERRRPDSNRGMTALQAVALPLGYGAGEPILSGALRQRQVRFDAPFSYNRRAMTKRRHEAIAAVRILSQGIELMTASTEALDWPIDEAPKASPIATTGGRIASVDALRGLTILLMVFVNDLGRAAPSWMHHIQPPERRRHDAGRRRLPRLPVHRRGLDPAGVRAGRVGPGSRCGLSSATSSPAPRALLFMGVIVLNSEDGRHARPAALGRARVHRVDPGVVRRPSRARPRSGTC